MSRLSFGSWYKHREFAPVVLRVVVGIVFFLHGYMKFSGMPGPIDFFGSLGIPMAPVMAWVVTLVEMLGGLALILGAFTRLSALLLAIDMLGVILFAKRNGLMEGKFIGGESPELETLLLAACIALAILGGGKWALDQRIFGQDRE